MIDHRKIIDHLTSASYGIDKLKEEPSPRIKKEEALGLSLKEGQSIRDKVTKKKGVIVYGTRKIVAVSSARGRG